MYTSQMQSIVTDVLDLQPLSRVIVAQVFVTIALRGRSQERR
jgi:hypothetical protein